MKMIDGVASIVHSDEKGINVEIEHRELVMCKHCKHYKPSDVARRWMCYRKDVDGMPVCYDFLPDDWCRYAERKEE